MYYNLVFTIYLNFQCLPSRCMNPQRLKMYSTISTEIETREPYLSKWIKPKQTKTNNQNKNKETRERKEITIEWIAFIFMFVCVCGGNCWPHEEKKEKVNTIWIIFIHLSFTVKKKTTFCLVIRIRTRLWSLCEAILSIFFCMTLFLKMLAL